MSTSWSVFDNWKPPTGGRTWRAVGRWTELLEHLAGAERKHLARLRDASDARLRDIGGDPLSRDWAGFLPLRRDREEDWSDWLGQLIHDSRTGRFAHAMLGPLEGRTVEQYRHPLVAREVTVGRYRADLVIDWSDRSYSHIEVKVGDTALDKTLETSIVLEDRLRGAQSCRSNILLILPSQFEDWGARCAACPKLGDRVRVITWIDVAVAIRTALPRQAGESLEWRVWARALCGAIEQELLNVSGGLPSKEWATALRLQELTTADRVLGRDDHAR